MASSDRQDELMRFLCLEDELMRFLWNHGNEDGPDLDQCRAFVRSRPREEVIYLHRILV